MCVCRGYGLVREREPIGKTSLRADTRGRKNQSEDAPGESGRERSVIRIASRAAGAARDL